MFQTVTPKLVSLLVDSDWHNWEDVHPDNFKHLPADFRCLSLPESTSDESPVYVHRCRKAIQSIRFTGLERAETMSNYPIRFPNLRCLIFRIDGWDMKENILTVNAAGLQNLQLVAQGREAFRCPCLAFRRFPSHVMFHNLRKLIIAK